MGDWQHFAQAALALTAVVTNPASVRPLETVHVQCRMGRSLAEQG